MKTFLRKHGSTLLFFVFLVLVLVPQTGTPIRVFINRLISFSPSIISEGNREKVTNFDWDLVSAQGDVINFSRSEGKVILVNIWATWCPPCIAELPALQNLYSEFKEEVDFYFVTFEDQEPVTRFLERKDYRIPVYFPKTMAPNELESASLPTTYLIAPNGEIVIRKVGSAKWDSDQVISHIRTLLNNPSP